MAKVVVTATTDADLATIITDLADKGAIDAALRYAAEFETFLDRLSEFPGSGATPAQARCARTHRHYLALRDHLRLRGRHGNGAARPAWPSQHHDDAASRALSHATW